MPAELTPKDGDSRGVRNLLCEQIDAVGKTLRGTRVSDGDIHSARKILKKARATLRLLRPGIAARVYRRENITLRDAARPLSAARDATVLLESLDRLEKLYGAAARQSIPAAFRRLLAREHSASRRAMGRTRRGHAASIPALRASRKRIGAARVQANGWKELGLGLKRVYGHGRTAMKQARRLPSPDCLHEWRKQAKHLWHQLQLLEPMWPGPIGALADQAHKLSDYLGDDHDLAVLRAKVTSHSEAFAPPGGPAALLALIDRCEQRLRAKAFFAGRRIYDDTPADFVARFERYWRRWQAERAESTRSRKAKPAKRS
jgi:CHAD domain-containing protein